VCFGGGKFLEVELQKISSYNLSHKVFHVEGPDSLLVSLYKSAFCLVYPSLYEGFGIPPLEAMALGCPVLASNVSSIPEVVGDAGILFDPLSEESLVTSIESLYNESKRNEMIKVGFGQERKFSWDRVTEETLEVYKNIS
jgi:glycosyltransferase involved in cell wall biosynthesis